MPITDVRRVFSCWQAVWSRFAAVVRWDGRGADGDIVTAGIYVIAVEGNGHLETRTVAVVH